VIYGAEQVEVAAPSDGPPPAVQVIIKILPAVLRKLRPPRVLAPRRRLFTSSTYETGPPARKAA
jgi:hypothetical protein